MASCQRVRRLAKGAGRLRQVTGDLRFVTDFFERMTTAGKTRQYQEIMETLAGLSDESVRGFVDMVELVRRRDEDRIATVATEVFNRIGDADIGDFLNLWRQARGSGPNAPRGLDVLANSMNGYASIRGVWFQLDFSKTKGFGSVSAYEASTSGTGVRGLDTILDTPIDGRFFECKAYDDYSVTQAMNQLRGLSNAGGPLTWRDYRVVLNTNSSATLESCAARMLDEIAEAGMVNQAPFSGIIATLRNRTGFDIIGFRQSGTFTGALATDGPHRRVITELSNLMFRGHPFDGAVGVGQ